MAEHWEIERKFIVTKPPRRWTHHKAVPIVQGYLPVAAKELEIRLRRKASKHYLTIKVGRGETRREEEFEIAEQVFRAVWASTRNMRVSKRRYLIPSGELTIEMDVYRGPHRGLITAEIEFGSQRESRRWKPPEWLGREVTGLRPYTNSALARAQAIPRVATRD